MLYNIKNKEEKHLKHFFYIHIPRRWRRFCEKDITTSVTSKRLQGPNGAHQPKENQKLPTRRPNFCIIRQNREVIQHSFQIWPPDRATVLQIWPFLVIWYEADSSLNSQKLEHI